MQLISMASNYNDLQYRRSLGEHGGVMMILAVLITVFVAMLALVVDSARQQVVVKQMQNAVDAATLAGASELDGTANGWMRAKRAALTVLRTSKLAEQGYIADADFKFTRGAIDSLDRDASFQGTEGDAGEQLTISFERGAYWASGDSDSMTFVSFEGNREQYKLNNFLIANAVQTKVQYRSMPTRFAKIFGQTLFGAMSRTAVAVKDTAEECVAPIAIPACSVMLDMDPYKKNRYETDQYLGESQCTREVVVAEADPNVNTRLEGLTRFESFNLPPYASPRFSLGSGSGGGNETVCFYAKTPSEPFLNCKALPLYGAMGIPAPRSETTAVAASFSEVEDIFQQARSCQRVKLGSRFKPLENPQHLNNGRFEQELARIVQSGESFSSAFGTNGNSLGSPMQNYPMVRRDRPDIRLDPYKELRVYFPRKAEAGSGIPSGGTRVSSMLMGQQGGISPQVGPAWAWNWANPLCHSRQLSFNDPYNAKAEAVTVMLIAPSDPSTSYCDFRGVFEQSEQRAERPTAGTKPIVVGFAKAHLFDFNVMALRDPVSIPQTAISRDRDSRLDYKLADHNPEWMHLGEMIGNKVYQDFGKYVEDFSDWFKDARRAYRAYQQCLQGCPRPGGGGGGGGCSCQLNLPPRPSTPEPPVRTPVDLAKCFDVPKDPTLEEMAAGVRRCGTVAAVMNDGNCEEELAAYQAELKKNNGLRASLPDKHCIPILKNDQPPSRPESWEVRSLAPQYGCGGLRLRMSCASGQTIFGAQPHPVAKASLVN